MCIRVLIAEDHALVRSGVKSLLGRYKHIGVVGEAENGREAVEMFEGLQPDVVLMDLSMPELNGIGAAELIRRQNKKVGLLVLSMRVNKRTVSDALRVGVDGFLAKDCVTKELVHAIEEVAGGRKYFCSTVASMVVEDQTTPGSGALDSLTLREKEVLQLLAEGHAVKEAASVLGIDRRTADCHKQRVLRKLGLKTVTELTRFAIQEGLVAL